MDYRSKQVLLRARRADLKAAERKVATAAAFRLAVVAAHEGGASMGEIAEVLGVSKSYVQQLVEKRGR